MEFNTKQVGKVEVIEVKGRLDLAGAEIAEKFFDKFLGSGIGEKNILVDFEGVDYISSSGLRVLVSALKEIQQQGGNMMLCNMNISVEEVFQFAGLDGVFQIYQTPEDAFRAAE